MDEDELARRVIALLLEVSPATVIDLLESGDVARREPGRGAADRGKRPVATFIASHRIPARHEVARRIRVGLQKRGTDNGHR